MFRHSFRFSPRLLSILIVLAALHAPVNGTRPARQLCAIPTSAGVASALHAQHATVFYASQYPNVDWSFQLLGEGIRSAKAFVKAWLTEGANCSGLIGPGSSSIAVAMSPILDVPWLDFAATSTELSDKEQFPIFSRVIPTDDAGAKGAVAVMLGMGWTSVSVLCVDDAYGRSVTAGVSTSLRAAGGGVAVQRCLPASTTEALMETALEAIVAGPTRVVYLGMVPGQQTFQLFVNVSRRLQLHRRLVFFFAEGACSIESRPYLEIQGSLCVAYTTSEDRLAPFLHSYYFDRDIAAIDAEIEAKGIPRPFFVNTSASFPKLAHDAAHHMMAAMSDYVAKGSVGDEVLHVRQFVSEGATGEVVLDANGDRATADMAVFNAVNGTEQRVGTVQNGSFSFLSVDTRVFLLTSSYSQGAFPGAENPVDEPSKASTWVIIALSALAGILVLGVVAAFVVGRLGGRRERDHASAPKDAAKPFTIVFTDIQGSTTLWARAPEEASDAVELHHTLIRQSIAAHHGYEVKTIGDAFMVAFTEAKDALKFSVEVQERLYSADWGPGQKALDSMYRNLISEHYGAQAAHFIPSDPKQYDELWAGLRVRIGMHFGFGEVKLDNITLGYDYYGTVVNTAARVEAVGHGGQICVTSAFLDEVGGALTAAEKYGVTATDLEEVTLRGLTDTTHLYQLVPVSLKARVFPSLRLDAESLDASAEKGAVHMDEEGVSLSSGSLSKSTRRKEEEEGRSVSRRSTAYEGGSSNIALEAFAARIVRQSGLLGVSADTHVERIIEAHTLVRAMLSTMRLPQRDRVIREVATKWRVEPSEPATHRPSGHRAERAFDETLVLILARTIRSLETQQQQHQHAAVAAMFQPAPPSLLEPIDPEPVADTPSVSVHRDETMILSAADGVSLHRREDTPTQGE